MADYPGVKRVEYVVVVGGAVGAAVSVDVAVAGAVVVVDAVVVGVKFQEWATLFFHR